MDVSIIVSTCNRSKDLERLFECLATQESAWRWELVLVDNNSSDDTAEIVRRLAPSAPFPVQYIFEGRQGKSFGLNSGIAAAKGRFLAFTDDDAILPTDWIDRLVNHFQSSPSSVFVGGMVKLYNPADAPVTIQLDPDPAHVSIENFSPVSIPILGCNMAIRAEAMHRVGPFDIDIGPGTKIGVAEDLDLQYRFLQAGYALDYVPEIAVFHNHGRRSPEQVERVMYGYLTGRGAFYCKHLLRFDKRVCRWLYWEVRGLLRWRTFAPFNRDGRRALRALRLLLLGAIRYLRFRTPASEQPA